MQVKDLSEIHEQITNMFPWPETKNDWDQYRLSKEQVDFFNENGYLPGIKMEGQFFPLLFDLSIINE